MLELGFGTGLNAILAARWGDGHKRSIEYLGFEPFPIPEKALQSWPWPAGYGTLALGLHQELHQTEEGLTSESLNTPPAPWGQHRFALHRGKFEGTASKRAELMPHADWQGTVQLIFHDAFSPDRDPESWQVPVLERMFHMLCPGGIWVSYCAKGMLRRSLEACGFVVERLPGPPFKREMLRASKP